jgi:hypothetical protein
VLVKRESCEPEVIEIAGQVHICGDPVDQLVFAVEAEMQEAFRVRSGRGLTLLAKLGCISGVANDPRPLLRIDVIWTLVF